MIQIKTISANFLLILVIITIFSCKKSTSPAQRIIGKYKLTELTFATGNVVKDKLAGNTHTNFVEFTTDLKVIRSIIPTSDSIVLSQETYTLSPNGKILTFTNNDGYSSVYTVKKLTNSVLKLVNSGTDTLFGTKLFSEINITYIKT